MKRIVGAAVVYLFFAAASQGAEIFGTISEGGKPLPAGEAVKLECGSDAVSGKTDQFGSYSLKTSGSGDCTLTLTYKGASASLKVTLYEKPSRYDLVVRQEAGKLEIARK
jgi:hypothetical protein